MSRSSGRCTGVTALARNLIDDLKGFTDGCLDRNRDLEYDLRKAVSKSLKSCKVPDRRREDGRDADDGGLSSVKQDLRRLQERLEHLTALLEQDRPSPAPRP
ncbi:hypothetical protein ACPCTO_36720 [Streptomyces olivoreticuli]